MPARNEHAPEGEIITLEVLRVASIGVLGKTEQLRVATPTRFGNAVGNLKEVESYKDVADLGANSAKRFLAALALHDPSLV